MSEITYLFGAGASAKVLPLVHDIPKRMSDVINHLENTKIHLGNDAYPHTPNKCKHDLLIEVIDILRWLKLESERHASVDTLAKKLIIREENDLLKKLKIGLSIFFTFLQAGNRVDKRYDAFYAALLNNEGNFPEHLRIVSWNYDYQFEMAYSEYSNNNDILSNQTKLRVNAKFVDKQTSGFGIYKINGHAGLIDSLGRNSFIYSEFYNGIDEKFLNKLVENYCLLLYHNDFKPALSFAFEQEHGKRPIVNRVINNVNSSSVVVVIGYSFPFFNREIDRAIFASMKGLKRVYFQSPDAEQLVERFKAIKDHKYIELIIRKDVDQFLLPNEL